MQYALYLLVHMIAGRLQNDNLRAIEFLMEQNRVLREMVPGKRLSFTDAQRRRLARAGKSLPPSMRTQYAMLMTPGTLLAWYRKLCAAKYDSSAKRRPGRPGISPAKRDAIIRFASDNRGWGLGTIVGAMRHLRMGVAESTVARVLKEAGIPPAPERLTHRTWAEFLRTHWEGLAAGDFFSLEVHTPTGIQRRYVLFVIELKSRKVAIAGIVRQPYEGWMLNVARGLTDAVDGFLLGKHTLILDRDPLFTKRFRQRLADAGTEVKRLPPNLNAYAERFIGSVRRQCLDHVIPLGERHLRHLVRE
jgi:putative transposase